MMLMGSCQQHQNRPNSYSKMPQPIRVRGHTLSKGEASVAVHLMIKHIMIVYFDILTVMAILMISYHVYSENIKRDRMIESEPEYRLFAIIIICRWLSRASDFVPCIRDIFFLVIATDHTVHHQHRH